MARGDSGSINAGVSDDIAELAQWMRLYTPKLLGVAQAFARDDDEAEDLLQEMWITAHRKSHQRSRDTPVGAWLYAIMLNIGRTRWRRRQRRAQLTALWRGSTDEAQTGAAPDIQRSLERARLWQEISTLPNLQRRVLLLRIVEDMTTAQAASQLGVAEGTVKASLHRALAALRRRYANQGILDETIGGEMYG
jgi:RNA polymerase sigma-70 factor (ECF subfamily)